MTRRSFLAAAAGSAIASQTACQYIPSSAQASGAPGSFELDEVSLVDLGSGLAQGKWTSARLVELYLARINAIDRNGPKLGCVLALNPDAASIARQLDQERKAGRLRGPLHGIPILVKDNIETRDPIATTAGSLALADWHAPQDAFVAARLRAAGAIILGKSNLSEWANYRSTHSSSGWSGVGGQTKNPYALDRNPSGSSSGSGAGASASLCGGAIGSETDGSVTGPSSINGICGIKPTVGLVSRSGIIPISASQDTAGPMARTVRDVAILLSAMTGVDPQDPATAASQGKARMNYAGFLDANGLHGARLGIARKFFANNVEMDSFLSSCVDALKKAGAEVVDPADLATYGQIEAPEGVVLSYEFKDGVNRYLTRLPAGSPARTLKDLIAFNEQNRDREMPFFDQELFLQSEAKGPLTDPAYSKARADCILLARTNGIDALLAQYKLDAIVTLTSGPAWPTDHVNGDRDTGGCTTPAAVAGYPHITVPAGYYSGLPIGLSFFGAAWSEPTLFKLAYAWEQQTNARRKPGFAASIAS
ncbi:MAG TPA: amidase [Bryobacteraceae bacterium]|nr:amidase [Bryobacteraceae bacterium]